MSNGATCPVMFIYKGERVITSRVLRPTPASLHFPPGSVALGADVADLPPGDYEYEIAGDDAMKGKRFRITIPPG